jgi:two-component system response regulator BaeR
MTPRILIVEDEPKLATLLADYLQAAGFATESVADGTLVAGKLRSEPFALLLLDLMLPGKDGLEVCKEVRAFSMVPIIMVTARSEEIDRLLGLELGADDYICKPFSPREVVARVKAVLRRSASAPQSPGLLRLDAERMRAVCAGQELDLTAVEFRILQLLAAHPGRIFSRSQLIDRIYPDRRIVDERTVDSHIKKLRRRLADAAPGVELIHAVYGVGYKFEE